MKYYAIVVTSKQVMSRVKKNSQITYPGQKFILTSDMWIDGTGTPLELYSPRLPSDVKVFDSKTTASKYAKNWKPHPWWINAEYTEVVEIEPVYDIVGFKLPDAS